MAPSGAVTVAGKLGAASEEHGGGVKNRPRQ
jgi:hypothetical protein